MDRLRKLLAAKVEREKQLAASGVAPPAEDTKECWLCGKKTRTRFRFRDGMRVCFSCFRITYLTLALPYIDTPARRQSDFDFLRRIAQLEKRTDTERGDASTGPAAARTSSLTASGLGPLLSTVEVADPSQAHFVMDASFMRRHRSHTSITTSSSPAAKSLALAPTMSDADADKAWSCPECTYFNRPGLRECEACGFVNPGTVQCPACGKRCPVVNSEEAGTKCTNGKLHVVWRCSECEHLNTLDGDACGRCHKPRYWACLQCTALHNNRMGQDGLRYCATCESYNTPDDVVRGQAKIEREHKKAELVAAQQREDSRRDYERRDYEQRDSDGGGVQFGVNDSVTLAEVQRQNEIERNRKRLQRRLASLSVPRHEQKSDGNCLFAALAHQLFGNTRLHTLVRSLIVAYMRANEDDYAILFESKKEWNDYVERMTQSGCWGDELCLNAAARCFCVNVHVITSDEKRWHMIFQQDQLGQSNSNLRDEVAALSRGPPPPTSIHGETPTQLSYTRRTGHHGGVPPPASSSALAGSDAVCLFLAYQAPVHYDDITPSPVKTIVLSDLLQPELHMLLKSQGGSPPPPVSAPSYAQSGALAAPMKRGSGSGTTLPTTSTGATQNAPAHAQPPVSLPALTRSSTGSGSDLPTRAAMTTTGRVIDAHERADGSNARSLAVPRSRGSGSSAGLSTDAGTLPPPMSAKPPGY